MALRGRTRYAGLIDTVYPSVPPAGMTAWYDISRLVGLVDNDAIASIDDYSGNAYHMLQSDAALKPIYKTAIINGYPAARFATDYVTCGNAFSIGNTVTFLMVFMLSDINTRQSIFGQENTANSLNMIDVTGADGYGTISFGNTAGSGARSAILHSTTYPHLVSFVKSSSTEHDFYQSGRILTIQTDATVNVTADGAKGLGRRAVGSQSFSGDLLEMIIYTSALSSADRLSGEKYLAGKYGIRMFID